MSNEMRYKNKWRLFQTFVVKAFTYTGMISIGVIMGRMREQNNDKNTDANDSIQPNFVKIVHVHQFNSKRKKDVYVNPQLIHSIHRNDKDPSKIEMIMPRWVPGFWKPQVDTNTVKALGIDL